MNDAENAVSDCVGWSTVPDPVSVKVPGYGPVAVPDAVNEKFPDCKHVTEVGPPDATNCSPLSVAGFGAGAAGAGTAHQPKVAIAVNPNRTRRFTLVSSVAKSTASDGRLGYADEEVNAG